MTALFVSMGGARVLPVDLLLGSIPSLPRHVLDRLVERAIDRLDEIDGDTDVEANGDELDTANAEDEGFAGLPMRALGPGCSLSDDDACVDDRGEDDRNGDV